MNNDSLRMLAGEKAGLDNPEEFHLGDFTYENQIIAEVMFKHLEATEFTGFTVKLIS